MDTRTHFFFSNTYFSVFLPLVLPQLDSISLFQLIIDVYVFRMLMLNNGVAPAEFGEASIRRAGECVLYKHKSTNIKVIIKSATARCRSEITRGERKSSFKRARLVEKIGRRAAENRSYG